jgi:hypothetical protein
MRARTLALAVLATSLLMAFYLGWALHRTSESVWIAEYERGVRMPRAWPYPDKWLVNWEIRLDAAHPAPGFIKLHGEWQRLRLYLLLGIGFATTAALCSFVWLLILERRDDESAPTGDG